MDEEYQRWCEEQAHAYLERIRRMGEDCAGLRAQIDDAYSRAAGVSGIDYAAVRVSASPTADAIPDAVARLTEQVRDYVADLAAYEDERHTAHMSIMAMADQTEARVLRYRYLLGWKWERICTEMDYSWDGMMKLRRRALADYYAVMPYREREPLEPAI